MGYTRKSQIFINKMWKLFINRWLVAIRSQDTLHSRHSHGKHLGSKLWLHRNSSLLLPNILLHHDTAQIFQRFRALQGEIWRRLAKILLNREVFIYSLCDLIDKYRWIINKLQIHINSVLFLCVSFISIPVLKFSVFLIFSIILIAIIILRLVLLFIALFWCLIQVFGLIKLFFLHMDFASVLGILKRLIRINIFLYDFLFENWDFHYLFLIDYLFHFLHNLDGNWHLFFFYSFNEDGLDLPICFLFHHF